MTPVSIWSAPPHDCERDGHAITLRLRRRIDGPEVDITPICQSCGLVFLPSAVMVGKQADWLMNLVDEAAQAKEAPPEAYEGMFD